MAAKKIPTLETKTVSGARRTFSETLNRVYRGETRVMIEKNGIPLGVLISPDELSDIQEMQRRREELRTALKKTPASFEDIPTEEIDREVEKAIEEAEEHRRQAVQHRASA